jgi:hypothetical protein
MKEWQRTVKGTITPTDIFTFYFIAFLLQTKGHEIGFREHELFTRELEDIRRKYLDSFADVVENQLVKYINSGRIDKTPEGEPHFDLDRISRLPVASRMEELDKAMNTTYRSDMQNRNEVWNGLTDHLVNLNKARKPENLIYYLDRVNNQVHNVPETVLYKLDNGTELAQAFDRAHQAKDPRDFTDQVKPEILNAAQAMGGGRSPVSASRERLFGARPFADISA